MKIAVYCGSRDGADPKYTKAARELGIWIGENGHTLIYGAGFVGMMGAVSTAVQESGGHVIGVIPQFMVDLGWERKDLEELMVTSSMSTRKAKMMELADVYIALPGGPGTLEEITEVISLAAVDQHEKECILLNQDGYYDPLRRMFERMVDQEFTVPENLTHVHFAADIDEVVRIAESACRDE